MNWETVRRLALLSHIALEDDECLAMAQDLSSLERLADQLEPLPSERDRFEGAVELSELREDTVFAGLERELLLDASPAHDGQTILVPRTVEE